MHKQAATRKCLILNGFKNCSKNRHSSGSRMNQGFGEFCLSQFTQLSTEAGRDCASSIQSSTCTQSRRNIKRRISCVPAVHKVCKSVDKLMLRAVHLTFHGLVVASNARELGRLAQKQPCQDLTYAQIPETCCFMQRRSRQPLGRTR